MTSNGECLTYFILALLFHLVSNLLKQPHNDLDLRDAFEEFFFSSVLRVGLQHLFAVQFTCCSAQTPPVVLWNLLKMVQKEKLFSRGLCGISVLGEKDRIAGRR